MKLSRCAFLAAAGLGWSGAALRPLVARASMNAPTAILIHGEFVNATIWRDVIPILTQAGLSAVAVNANLQSASEDVAALLEALGRIRGDTVLVGHSYGGSIMSSVPNWADRKVRGLVYVAGLAQDENETFEDILNRFPRLPSARDVVLGRNGLVLAREKFAADYAADIAPSEADALAGAQSPIMPDLLSEAAPRPAWKRLRSWYAVSTDDRLLPPAAQTFFAARMRAETITVRASHASPLSHAAEIASLILRAANS